jgi:putative FmdB family regulatory protein
VPIYEYECETCHHRFELMQKFSDKPIKKCTQCGSPVHKVLSPPALIFKGTGWYVTDYARPERERAKNRKSASEAKGNGGSSSEASSSTSAPSTPAASTTKSETKSEVKSDKAS